MKYSTDAEILLSPSLSLDGMDHESCKTISDFTGINLAKLVYFGQRFGVKTILDRPSLMGLTQDQETRLEDLRKVIFFGGDETYGTDVTAQPV
ncbi:MAG TPA: hypothetical protein DD730_13460 [Desulfosporosinus sp.]|jgi:hypothetical protein|nr:hypothetical protein [Desulfosporosinus sp.]